MADFFTLPLDVVGLITAMLDVRTLFLLRCVSRSMRDRISRSPVVCSECYEANAIPMLSKIFPRLSGIAVWTKHKFPVLPTTVRDARFHLCEEPFPGDTKNVAALTALTRLALHAENFRVSLQLPSLEELNLNPDFLVSLHLVEVVPTVEAVAKIASFKRLNHLSVSLSKTCDPMVLHELPLHSFVVATQGSMKAVIGVALHFKSLQTLEISAWDLRMSQDDICLEDFVSLTRLTSLQTLKLGMSHVKGIAGCDIKFPRLRAAFLSRCEQLYWDDIVTLVNGMPELYIVHISGLKPNPLERTPLARALQVLAWPGSCVLSREDAH